jgi:hypothetical protein
MNAISSNIEYELTFSNNTCLVSGTCAGGNQVLYTGGNAISGCISTCTRTSNIKTSDGTITINWEKTNNASNSCTTGPCYADDLTTIRVYINGSEATSFGSPWQYVATPSAELVTDSVVLTGITYLDTIKVTINEG